MTGRPVPSLPPPDVLLPLWNHFVRLDQRRTSNGFGQNRIGWVDLAAYCSLLRVRLDPWEVDAIQRLDDEYFRVEFESQEQTAAPLPASHDPEPTHGGPDNG